MPISGVRVGDDMVAVVLTLPDGTRLEKALPIGVRLNEPPVATTDFVSLAPGSELAISADRLANLTPGTASVQISASGAGRLNVPAILRALDRYPYGCTEQITSRAMPLVYLNDVAIRAGLGGDPDIHDRVEKAIAGVLANQSASGSFGLWAPGSEDMWLDAYVTDFLTRARQKGFAVPAEAFDLALDNLKNRLAYAGDFTNGGEDIAYALYVLASNGRAAIGDLRYYAETKLGDFATPLAKAQIGAALALYGDKPRADAVFRVALSALAMPRGSDQGLAQRLRLLAPRRRRGADARFRDALRHRPRQPVDPRRGAACQRALHQHAGGRLVADGGACADGKPRPSRSSRSTAS